MAATRALYRLLRRLWPRRVRREHGRELETMFLACLEAARRCDGAGEVFRDARFATRSWARERSFTLTVLATLLVCIGGNTVIFSIVRSVLLKPLPITGADRIVLVSNLYPKFGFGAAGPAIGAASVPDYLDRRRDVSSFDKVVLYRRGSVTLGAADGAERLNVLRATPSFYSLVGAGALAGRAFAEQDGEPGHDAKVMLSYAFWRRRYGGDPALIGRDVRLDGRPFQVIGILPAGFTYLWKDVDFWLPLSFTDDQRSDASRHSNNWVMLARLAAGASIDSAQRELDALNARNDERFPQFQNLIRDGGYHSVVVSLQDEVVRDVRQTLYLLWAGAVFVLLIGGVNLANLFLMRSTVRWRELATRHAIGASLARVGRQVLTETTMLAMFGGVGGIVAGWWILHLLARLDLEMLPRSHEIGIDWLSAATMLALAAAVGVASGLIPLVRLAGINITDALRDAGRSGTASAAAGRLRRLLVTAQIALAFVLLIGAALLLASFRAVLAIDPGFEPAGVVTAAITLPASAYRDPPALAQVAARLLDRARALPGVASAGVTATIPFGGNYSSGIILAAGSEPGGREAVVAPHLISASDGYFEAMRIPLVRGRYFDRRDTAAAPPVVIVDERLARRFWPGRDAVGQQLLRPANPSGVLDLLKPGPDTRAYTVVGVVANVQLTGLTPKDPPVGAYYFPYAQQPVRSIVVAVRGVHGTGTDAIVAPLRAALTSVDRELPLYDVRTMDERLDRSLIQRRLPMVIAIAFGAVALFLAAIGVYGVLAAQVAERRREIGIRMALGSSAADVRRLVMRDGARMTLAGIAVGLGGTAGLARVISGLLYGVGPADAVITGGVALLLAAVALVATWLPAHRAAHVNPAAVLNE
jgi:predicted permease